MISKTNIIDVNADTFMTDIIEASKKKIAWGSQIRNYVLHPYKIIKDVRTGYESGNTEAVLNGDLNEFLKSFLLKGS